MGCRGRGRGGRVGGGRGGGREGRGGGGEGASCRGGGGVEGVGVREGGGEERVVAGAGRGGEGRAQGWSAGPPRGRWKSLRPGARAEAEPAGPWTRDGDAAPARWQDGRGRDPRPECDPRPRTAPLPRSRPLGAEEGSPGRGRPQCPPQTEVSRRRGPGRRIWAGECRPGPFLAKFQPVPGATGTWQGEPPPQHHAVPRATHSAADRGWFLFAHGQTG